MSSDTVDIFVNWLTEQEAKKGWTDYRLAAVAKINPSVLSRARSGTLPKWDACMAISHAFKVSPITVFRKAGLLPPGPDDEISLEDWKYLLEQMTPEERDELMQIGTMRVERRQQAEQSERAKNFKIKKAG